MKLKKIIVGLAWLSSAALPVVQAAVELTSEKAATLQPFMKITITARCNSLHAAAAAVSHRADKTGADAFYIHHYGNSNNGGNWRILATLYHKNPPAINAKEKHRVFNGVKELTEKEANELQFFDTVSIKGFFPAQPDINDAITKAAKQKGADAFFITRQSDTNHGGNQFISALIYKSDAPKREEQHQSSLLEGNAQVVADTKKIPETTSGHRSEHQAAKAREYTVTLSDGTQVQELSKIAAAQRVPFDYITFTGHFSSISGLSEAVARRAAARGAKYYQITRQWQNHNGGNLTVSANLFK